MRALTEQYEKEGRLGTPWTEGELNALAEAVKLASAGRNRVIIDDCGIPSVMREVERRKVSELLLKGSDALHPAFPEDGRTLYVSVYQNVVINGRAYSLPYAVPEMRISQVAAAEACRAKGEGWSLTSYFLRAELALSALRQGFLPGGNTEGGHNYRAPGEKGCPAAEGVVRTGSGPETWALNGCPDGIYDLVGNLNEWDEGFRIRDGELQFLSTEDILAGNTGDDFWYALDPDGRKVPVGSDGSLCFTGNEDGRIVLGTRKPGEDLTLNCAFGEFRPEAGFIVPEKIRASMLFPEERPEVYDGWRWIRTKGEYYPLCGGGNQVTYHAGLFFTGMTHEKDFCYNLSGFRSMYAE